LHVEKVPSVAEIYLALVSALQDVELSDVSIAASLSHVMRFSGSANNSIRTAEVALASVEAILLQAQTLLNITGQDALEAAREGLQYYGNQSDIIRNNSKEAREIAERFVTIEL